MRRLDCMKGELGRRKLLSKLPAWIWTVAFKRNSCFLLTLTFVLAVFPGCATPVFRNLENTIPITPIDVQQSPGSFDGAEILWGGRIVSVENLEGSTRVEVIAYPLNRAQQPVPDADSIGRFMLFVPGFAEPVDYAPGRHLTAQGVVSGTWQGLVEGQNYPFPVVRVSAVNIWPWGFMLDSQPQISIGIGIGSQFD